MKFTRLFGILALASGLLASIASPVALAEDSLRLNFGVYTANKPSAMVKVFRPVLKELEVHMSRKLAREVDIRMQIAKDYDKGIAHLVNGRVDFSHFGPASYVEAKRMNEQLSILAVENKKNSKVSYGIIAVAADSEIQDISDLRGKAFAFGDEGSTIGRFLSQLKLEQSGIRAGDLSRYEYLGRHDKVGTAVGAGAFDAGALNEKTFKKLVESGIPIRELVRFPNVAKPFVARSGLDPVIRDALRDSLLEITNKKALAAMKIDGFLEGSDEDYRDIRNAMEYNHRFFEDHEPDANNSADLEVSASEPTMQAAQSDSNRSVVASANNLAITTQSGQHVTLNITLPISLFVAEDGQTLNAVTINLSVPDLPAEPAQ